MKVATKLVLLLLFILSLAGLKVYCQTVAVGHVTAEVIESVSVASNAIMNFEFSLPADKTSNQTAQTKPTSKVLDLGAVTLYSGNNIAYDIVIQQGSLSNSAGNTFTFEPSLKTKTYSSATKTDGAQTIQFDGKVNPASNQESGLYQGTYTVVFAYN